MMFHPPALSLSRSLARVLLLSCSLCNLLKTTASKSSSLDGIVELAENVGLCKVDVVSLKQYLTTKILQVNIRSVSSTRKCSLLVALLAPRHDKVSAYETSLLLAKLRFTEMKSLSLDHEAIYFLYTSIPKF